MFLPYSTDRRLQRVPWATISIIAFCVVIEGLALADPELRHLLAFNPDALRVWQPFTAMFAHADPLHLIGNMLFLWIFGSHVEDTVGVGKYLLVYVTAGLLGTWLQGLTDAVFLHQVRGGIGASGAIMGLLALFALRYRSVNVNILYCWNYYRSGVWKVPALYVGAFYVVFDLLQGAGTGLLGIPSAVGNFAHVGGFAAGVGWCYALRLPVAAAVDEDRGTAEQFAAAGAYGAAAAAMQEAASHDPSDPNLRLQAALYLQMKPNTLQLAIPEWNAALRLWMERGETETALENWQKARQALPVEAFDPETMCNLAVVWEKRGHLHEAGEIYHSLATRGGSEDAPLAVLRLADLLARQGQTAQARQWYRHVLQAWPDTEEAFSASDRERRLPARP